MIKKFWHYITGKKWSFTKISKLTNDIAFAHPNKVHKHESFKNDLDQVWEVLFETNSYEFDFFHAIKGTLIEIKIKGQDTIALEFVSQERQYDNFIGLNDISGRRSHYQKIYDELKEYIEEGKRNERENV
jgi:hypothetical protein